MLFFVKGFSQTNGIVPGGWRFTAFNGEVNLKGLYRDRYTTMNNLEEYQKGTYFSGGIKLNTKSYIWHPNFILLEMGGEFAPESNLDDYLVSPDFSEVRTLKGLNIGTTLFGNKPVTLTSWARWSDTYSNREKLTNIKTITQNWGSSLYVRSKILPVNLRYNNTIWDQTEIQTDRTYRTEQENFEASTQKSFGKRDQNELSYSHDRYFRSEPNLFKLENITDNIRLNNSIFLDKKKKHSYRSMIYDYNRTGSQVFHIFNITENLMLRLPLNFDLVANYNLYNQQQEFQESHQDKASGSLTNRLFSSLTTNIFYNYSAVSHTLYHETRNNTGATVNYTKKIPAGTLNLSYNFSLLRNNMENEPVNLPVINDEYLLKDGEITMLEKPYIDINSIVVKDATGSIIYRRDLDYILIEKGVYVEIQRLPGGQIANNSAVYIDYVVVQTGSYRYDAITNNFNGNIVLFKRFLELYYRGMYLDYKNVEKSDLLILNYVEQKTFGGKINIKFTELGAEYEDHNSTITPYRLMRYYVNIQKRIKKFLLSVNGNYRDYNMVDENINRLYYDVSGSAGYEFAPNTRIEMNIGYRKQQGPGIDLDLITGQTEFKTNIRMIFLTLGTNLYRRNYLGDKMNYNSVYIQLARRF
jgi:hypothetical protein